MHDVQHGGEVSLDDLLARFPRTDLGHLPTPLEPLPRLGAELGTAVWAKRDDCTGIAFGGNKIRQLNYYLGAARARDATTVLITGAVQSNFVRATAAMAAALGMRCHIQLENRVDNTADAYVGNGNVLLDRLLGAELSSYPDGEDEEGADRALHEMAEQLAGRGERPYVVPLGADHPPLGALGYVEAAAELIEQRERFSRIYVASGSALTHCGLLFGLRLLGDSTEVVGVCVRRDESAQRSRVARRLDDLATLLGIANPVRPDDVVVTDSSLAPGYGLVSTRTGDALRRTAQAEGLFLDPVYTAKTMAALIADAEAGGLGDGRALFWHTGGQPALFGYTDQI